MGKKQLRIVIFIWVFAMMLLSYLIVRELFFNPSFEEVIFIYFISFVAVIFVVYYYIKRK